MNTSELKRRLDAKKVPDNLYDLLIGGFPNEAFCLVKTEDGWEVYYSERGYKRNIQKFAAESEACEYLEKELEDFMALFHRQES